MKKAYALLALLLCCSWAACANKAMTIHVSRTSPVFEVTLPANPTTGYQWGVIQYETSLLALESQQYIASSGGLVGAGGVYHCTFQLLSGASYPKQTEIVFKYARAWDPTSGELTYVTVQFD